MKPGAEVTVTWLPELAPTHDSKSAVIEVFERQTGQRPTMYFVDGQTGVWGFISEDAALLFRAPKASTS